MQYVSCPISTSKLPERRTRSTAPHDGLLACSRGMGIVDLMVSMAISVFLVATAASAFLWTTRAQIREHSRGALMDVRSEMVKLIENPIVVEAITDHAANAATFACLTDASVACPTDWTPAVFVMPDDTPLPFVFSPDGGTSRGFTQRGAPCSGFNPAVKNESCPYQAILSWRPLCRNAGCTFKDLFFRISIRQSANASNAHVGDVALSLENLNLVLARPYVAPPGTAPPPPPPVAGCETVARTAPLPTPTPSNGSITTVRSTYTQTGTWSGGTATWDAPVTYESAYSSGGSWGSTGYSSYYTSPWGGGSTSPWGSIGSTGVTFQSGTLASADFDYSSNPAGSVWFEDPMESVTVKNLTGDLYVSRCSKATVTGVTGDATINADDLEDFQSGNGLKCSAKRIKTVKQAPTATKPACVKVEESAVAIDTAPAGVKLHGCANTGKMAVVNEVKNVKSTAHLTYVDLKTVTNVDGPVLLEDSKVDTVSNVKGTIRLSNCQVKRLSNITGDIVLTNGADVGEITNHTGRVIRE